MTEWSAEAFDPSAPPGDDGPPDALEAEDVVRCAEWTRQQAVDPIGTAGTYSGYLLVEWPLPWPADLSDIPDLAPVVDALNGTGIRLQGLVSTRLSDSRHHVILYHKGSEAAEGFSGFVRHEEVVDQSDVVPTCLQMLDHRGSLGAADPLEPVLVDVLICGHGRRDRCCGAQGTRLARNLASLNGGRLRLWRTSHTGGHRFAPTMVVLPEATVWAFVDEDLVRQVTRRSGNPADLMDRYRGCSGLSSRQAQVVERAALAEFGWSLLDSARVSNQEDGGPKLNLRVAGREGVASWEAEVSAGRTWVVPACGQSIDQATKTETELSLRHFERLR